MKQLFIYLFIILFTASCSKEVIDSPDTDDRGLRISLQQEGVQVINTRTATPDMEAADSRIENVIIYAFDKASGELTTKYEQELDYPDNEVRMVLQGTNDLVLHAVCNANDAWFASVGNVSDLENKIIQISDGDGVFKGSVIMHGELEVAASDISNTIVLHKIYVKRLAAKVSLNIVFAPIVATDKFYLNQVIVNNIPSKSYLMARDWDSEFTSAEADAVYASDAEIAQNNYIQNYRLPYEEPANDQYTATFYLFENRRGGLDNSRDWFDMISDSDPDKANLQQVFKAKYGKEKFPLSSYVQIEGTYVSDEGHTTRKASYRLYLGASNDKDFNIKRNSLYNYTATIRTCDELDTRVEMVYLNNATMTPAFTNPLDAHCNALKCFAFSKNKWEIYVENPDKTPWLEVSMAAKYKPHFAGETYTNEMASSRISGEEKLSDYIYIHTDEYVPENNSTNETLNTQDPSSYRVGYVVLRDKVNGTTSRIKVEQRPAQIIKMPVKDLLGHVKFYNEYYVEYELEKKNMQWGFLKYPANPTMTSMINDRWDGLSNTRKLYDEAVRKGGMYNPTGLDPALVHIPEDMAIGYAVTKNRDRNGNGRLDYEEIVWYVPALDELAELRRVMDEGHLVFQNSDDKFYSSTPYLAGYTDAIPGRAFYVKMRNGEKAFTMRNRYYNVICCRRKGAWMAGADAGFDSNITNDDAWNEEDEIMPKQ